VQPCMSAGFGLMPSGFYDKNPSNDLPRETNKASVLVMGDGVACEC